MMQPATGYSPSYLAGWSWAADNGCFAAKWDASRWQAWLAERHDDRCLFAVVPDVVADADATGARWAEWSGVVKGYGYRAAYVLQDGETSWPHDADALFIGGSTAWKLSSHAERIVRRAKSAGLWVHMGRVNSLRRLRIAESWGCDSADGTFLAFGPDVNTPRLLSMLAAVRSQRSLFGGAA